MNAITTLIVAGLLSLLIGSAIGADAPRAFFPFVAHGAPVASQCSPVVPLLDQDTGSLDAALTSDGRYILAYQDREHGSRAHIVQHVGAGLVEVTEPLGGVFVEPSFSPPGVKQGSLALVAGAPGQRNRLYFTQRKEGDTTGPYALWCMEF